MTVISSVISNVCTAHASDSYVTSNFNIVDKEYPKTIRIPEWSGIMSVFGTVKVAGNIWSVTEFIARQLEFADKGSGPENFAEQICDALNRIPAVVNEGIGIHFTAYESYDGYLIPELFQITNYLNTNYQVDSKGIQYRRETYAKIRTDNDTSERLSHGEPSCRHKVREFLKKGNIFVYNNGDPILFNLSANSIFKMLEVAAERNALRSLQTTEDHRKLVTWPVNQVADLQKTFFLPGKVIVGGKVQSLSVTPSGQYEES